MEPVSSEPYVTGTSLAPSPDDIEVQAAAWQQYFELGQRYEQAAGYATYRILRVLNGLRKVLYEVTSAAHTVERRLGMANATVPHMAEFLSFVYDEDRERVAKQKHWP